MPTYRESLRDIQACLRAAKQKTYHKGIRGKISCNTPAHAKQTSDWRIYADFAQVLIQIARQLYAKDTFGIEIETNRLCPGCYNNRPLFITFPLSIFRKNKGAAKLHALFDLKGNIPTIAFMTSGKVHRVNILDNLSIQRHLHHGSRLSGLRASLQTALIRGLLCDTRHEQRQIQSLLLPEDRQNTRILSIIYSINNYIL